MNRGLAYYAKGDHDRAVADYDQKIKLDPKFALAYYNRGLAYYAKGDRDRSIAEYDQAIRLNPQYAPAYTGRGLAYNAKGDHDRAIADYDQAIKIDPKYAAPYNNRGNAYYAKGDYDRAIADYDQALKLNPANAEAHQNRERAMAALAARPSAAEPQPALAPQPVSPPAIAERRVALVIGNSAYRSVAFLPNPRRDAEAVADALRRDGFQTVTLKSDLGRDALREALRAFREAADTADWGLIYYAGHGIQIGKTNYLVPVDARLRDERDVEGETISYGELEKAVSGAKALRLIILDACRVDPFEPQMARLNPPRSPPRGLLPPPEPEPGMLIVYSAKDGQIAEDGDSANSPFALALVAQLKVPGREVRRLFDYVRDDVLRATNKHQMPFTYGSLPGDKDFFFVSAR